MCDIACVCIHDRTYVIPNIEHMSMHTCMTTYVMCIYLIYVYKMCDIACVCIHDRTYVIWNIEHMSMYTFMTTYVVCIYLIHVYKIEHLIYGIEHMSMHTCMTTSCGMHISHTCLQDRTHVISYRTHEYVYIYENIM